MTEFIVEKTQEYGRKLKMDDFTYKWYEDLIDLIAYNEYEVCDYFNYNKPIKGVILRHDIDLSIEKAIPMAELESRKGVSSTYFVLVSSEFYNIFSKRNEERLKYIIALGHKIGLHFDEKKYDDSFVIKKEIQKEISVLEYCIEEKVKVVSMHRPSQKTLEANYAFGGGIINSYGEEFFIKIKYVSDSRKHWREDVKGIISSRKFPKLQILTHPFSYNEQQISFKEGLSDFCACANRERYLHLEENVTNLNEIVAFE